MQQLANHRSYESHMQQLTQVIEKYPQDYEPLLRKIIYELNTHRSLSFKGGNELEKEIKQIMYGIMRSFLSCSIYPKNSKFSFEMVRQILRLLLLDLYNRQVNNQYLGDIVRNIMDTPDIIRFFNNGVHKYLGFKKQLDAFEDIIVNFHL